MEICKVWEKESVDFLLKNIYLFLELNFGQVILKMVEVYRHHLILFQVRNQFIMLAVIYIVEYLVVQKHI